MIDLHKKWNHRWILSKAIYFKSQVQGGGVTAIEKIRKDKPVMCVGGISVPRSEILKYRKNMGHIGLQVDEDFFIVPTNLDEIRKTGSPNHSCEPNIGMRGSVVYVAIRNIKKGEELFLDYAFMETYFKPFQCNCGSKNCRKVIKPTDWKNKKIQKKYGRYFSPYLREKFL